MLFGNSQRFRPKADRRGILPGQHQQPRIAADDIGLDAGGCAVLDQAVSAGEVLKCPVSIAADPIQLAERGLRLRSGVSVPACEQLGIRSGKQVGLNVAGDVAGCAHAYKQSRSLWRLWRSELQR